MRIAILAALALFAVSSSAYASCRKPAVPAEYVVCSDHTLVKLVEKRRRLYRLVHQKLPKKQQRALYANHWHWLNAYPGRCGVAKRGKPPSPITRSVIACFEREVKARIAYLNAYPHAPAAAQAHPARVAKAKAEARAKAAQRAKAEAKARAEKKAKAQAQAEAEAKARAAAEARAEAAEKAAEQARKAAEAAVAEAQRAKAEAVAKQKAEAAQKAQAESSPAPAAAPKPAPAAQSTLAALPPGEAGANGAAANGEGVPALPGTGPDRYHLKFTFACRTRAELARVLASLAKNDFSYALSQPECLPVPDGRPARLLTVDGTVARVRLCSPATGCTDVYADASTVLDSKNQPVGK